jgi:hypothetical protein
MEVAMILRKLTIAIVTITAGFVLAGCGGGGEGINSNEIVPGNEGSRSTVQLKFNASSTASKSLSPDVGGINKSSMGVEAIRINTTDITAVNKRTGTTTSAQWINGESNIISLELGEGEYEFVLTDHGTYSSGKAYEKSNSFTYTFITGYSYVITIIVGLDFAFDVNDSIDLSNINSYNYFERPVSAWSYAGLYLTSPNATRFILTVENAIRWLSDRSRGGGTLITKQSMYLDGKTIEFVWSGSGGGSFMQTLTFLALENEGKESGAELYLDWLSYGVSYDGTFIVNENVVYKSVFTFAANSCTTQMFDESGTLIYSKVTPVDLSKKWFFAKRLGDTQMNESAFLEVKSGAIK